MTAFLHRTIELADQDSAAVRWRKSAKVAHWWCHAGRGRGSCEPYGSETSCARAGPAGPSLARKNLGGGAVFLCGPAHPPPATFAAASPNILTAREPDGYARHI